MSTAGVSGVHFHDPIRRRARRFATPVEPAASRCLLASSPFLRSSLLIPFPPQPLNCALSLLNEVEQEPVQISYSELAAAVERIVERLDEFDALTVTGCRRGELAGLQELVQRVDLVGVKPQASRRAAPGVPCMFNISSAAPNDTIPKFVSPSSP